MAEYDCKPSAVRDRIVHLFGDSTYPDRAKRSVRERITRSTCRGFGVSDN